MSRASTEMEEMRTRMLAAVDLLSPEDVRAMLVRSLTTAVTYEMTVMAEATSYASYDNLVDELDLYDV